MSAPRGATRPIAVLIGFMGAGKSTVGRILADRFGVDFVDTDAEITRVTGRTVPEIFVEDGEVAFRETERRVVADLLDTHGGVIALGGGAVMTPATAEALDGHRVIYLRIDPDSGFARVEGSDRPLLAADNRRERYRDLLQARGDTYSGLAAIEVDAAAGDPDEVADTIVTALAELLVPERNS